MALFSGEKPADEVAAEGKKGKKEKKEAKEHKKRASQTATALLKTREEASEQFRKAQQAEQEYINKKKAAAARENYDQTAVHFKEAFSHSGEAFKGLFAAVTAIPWIINEKKEKAMQSQQEAAHKRNLEKKKKLEEALAKHTAEDK